VKEDKVISKSREKEKRKAARAQDEISMFLKPNKMPLQPTSLNKGSVSSSTHAKDRRSVASDQLDSNYLGRHHERSQSFDFPQKPSLDFRRTKPTSDILSASVGRNPVINRLEYGPHSTSQHFRESIDLYLLVRDTGFTRCKVPEIEQSQWYRSKFNPRVNPKIA